MKTAKDAFDEYWNILKEILPKEDRHCYELAFHAGMLSWSLVVGHNVRQGMKAREACATLDKELDIFVKKMGSVEKFRLH